jgi:hypothetical protein
LCSCQEKKHFPKHYSAKDNNSAEKPEKKVAGATFGLYDTGHFTVQRKRGY